MNPSEKDQVLLDEKIALIRKKNEMIIKKTQLIEKEIELAKKYNAMVDVSAPKTLEDDKPTLYSDTIPNSHREERKRSISDKVKVNYKPRSNITKEDAAWRAERNEIDRERIRRQRADSGWKREWDADKLAPDNDFPEDSFNRRGYSKEISHARSSHNQNAAVDRSELLVSTRQNQYKSTPSDVSVERSEKAILCQTQSRGRGRPIFLGDNPKIIQNSRGTVNVEPSNIKKEKTPLKKRVSWRNENELLFSPRISLKDDHLKNIKVKVNAVDRNARNRSVEITGERGPLVKNKPAFKFDEKTSFNIKDCVAKASSVKQNENRQAIEDAAPPSKSNEHSSVKLEPKSIIVKRNLNTQKEPTVVSNVAAAEQLSKQEGDLGDDEEWEDLSGEEWESASDEE